MSFIGHENENYKHTHLCVVQKKKNVFKQKKCMVVMTKTEKLVAFPSPLMEVTSLTQVSVCVRAVVSPADGPSRVLVCSASVSFFNFSFIFGRLNFAY